MPLITLSERATSTLQAASMRSWRIELSGIMSRRKKSRRSTTPSTPSATSGSLLDLFGRRALDVGPDVDVIEEALGSLLPTLSAPVDLGRPLYFTTRRYGGSSRLGRAPSGRPEGDGTDGGIRELGAPREA